MLFMIIQVRSPESCPIDAGGSSALFDQKVKGVKLLARYGACPQHVIWYVVEADTADAIQQFLNPGFSRCTSTITPILESWL